MGPQDRGRLRLATGSPPRLLASQRAVGATRRAGRTAVCRVWALWGRPLVPQRSYAAPQVICTDLELFFAMMLDRSQATVLK